MFLSDFFLFIICANLINELSADVEVRQFSSEGLTKAEFHDCLECPLYVAELQTFSGE